MARLANLRNPWMLGMAVTSVVSYRKWHSAVVGESVTQVWEGYAARVFISFGQLTPSDYTLRNGSPGRPHGIFELTNMSSLSGWRIILNGHQLASSESPEQRRERVLQRLAGSRLLSLEIEAKSRATILTFTRGLIIVTKNLPGSREQTPHWSLRISNDNWPPVVLLGTGYRWRDENRRLQLGRRADNP
jgi:hypothetical protein